MAANDAPSPTIAAPGDPLHAALRACRRHLVHCALFSGFINVLFLAPSVYMLQVYDRAIPSRGVETLLMLTLMLVAATATMASLEWLRSRLLIRASARLDRLLAPPLIAELLRGAALGARSSAALREFDQLRTALTGAGAIALFDAPWAPVYLIVCFLVHPAIAAVALGAMLLLTALSILNERATSGPLKQASVASAISFASLDGSLGHAGVVRALGMREGLVERHVAERAESLSRQVRASAANTFYVSVIKGLRVTLQSLALGLGAYLAMTDSISGGAVFAASLLISRALAPIEGVTAASKGLIQATAAYRSLRRLFAEAGTVPVRTALPAPTGRLQVEGLTVLLPRREAPVLAGVSFRLPAGAVLGIVGPSGAGKSTLARALVGAVVPRAGCVRLDGARLDDWDEAQLGRAIGYVPQEASLFRGTVRDNISRFATGRRAEIDAAAVAAAQEAGAHDMILSLPRGYDTELGAGGRGLSSGQAQRVALARALYGRPVLVVLDEPNANLDGDGDAQMFDTIARLRARGATVLLIAHRTSVLRAADTLLVMRDGRIAHFGERDEVLRQLVPPAPAAIGPNAAAHAAPHAGGVAPAPGPRTRAA